MKHRYILAVILMLYTLTSGAVLKEKNLESTLAILRNELTLYHNDLEGQTEMAKMQQQRVWRELRDIMNRSSQNSLMLYSQKPDYIFDLTYACHEATEQYAQFKHNVTPFVNLIKQTDSEIARYDSLIINLSQMHDEQLSAKGQIDRNVCLTLAVNIRRTLNENTETVGDYIKIYDMTEQRLKRLNDYAQARYEEIQRSIFSNGGDDYITLMKNLKEQFQETRSTIGYKYHHSSGTQSQWDTNWIIYIFVYILFYALLSMGLGVLLIRVVLPRVLPHLRGGKLDFLVNYVESSTKGETFFQIITVSVVFLALVLGIVSRTWTSQNFILMASGLLLEFTWMLAVILISLQIRLHKKNLIATTFRIYVPLIVVSFIVIAFRIVLIPSEIVNLVFPPLLLACLIWQLTARNRHVDGVERSDVFFGNATSLIFVVSMACSVVGYTLLSVQLLIWWTMQLACILTITCIRDFTASWASRKEKIGQSVKQHWAFRLFYHVVIPVSGVWSILLAIYFAAQVFNLGDTTRTIFLYRLIDSENFCLSIYGIVMVAVLYYVFSYIHHTVNLMLRAYFARHDAGSASSISLMTEKVTQIVVWGAWFLIVLAIFHVSNTWLVVISGGLSTGVGFASKDIIENIYYGISLMTGRIKIGDLIECDGVRGRVSSISYTSTLIDTIDGSVIAFQNSQLFVKNYKNLTRNHGQELVGIMVGVAYGCNLKDVKDGIVGALSAVKTSYFDPKRVSIVVSDFGDNSINLKVYVWADVIYRSYAISQVLETIYTTLGEMGVEIPFPQRDLHIINNPA